MNYFEKLNNVNVNDKTEERSGLTYLAWAYAWGELKKLYPMSFYTIYENAEGRFYHHDGKTAWVKTGVTVVDGELKLEHIEYLPVMDYRNKSIPVDSVTSFDVNKAIQRSLTKAIARHGLGLYIYAGEDLPDGEEPIKESVVPMSKRLSSPVVKEPVTVKRTSSETIVQRNKELKELLSHYNKTLADYKAIAGERTVAGLTEDEYTNLLAELQKAWA